MAATLQVNDDRVTEGLDVLSEAGLNRTPIEWTHWSANPLKLRLPDGSLVNACVKISEGCRHCYAETLVRRFWRKRWRELWGPFPGYSAALLKIGTPVLVESVLRAVLRLDRRIAEGKADPAVNKVFWSDMTDEYLAFWPDWMRDRIWAVRALTRNLIHQVLTKRVDRMAGYLSIGDERRAIVCDEMNRIEEARRGPLERAMHDYGEPSPWPLPNVWVGTSVENQKAADKRVPDLLRCPAAVRFISAEPLLGPVNIARYLEFVTGVEGYSWPEDGGIDQVITGNESRGAGVGRFADGFEAAARSLLNQCRDAGVAYFGKQFPVNGRTSHDPAEWPADLRVREFPKEGPCSA